MSLPKLPQPMWQVRIDGNVYEADTPTLRAWVQEGRVLPTDSVKFGSGDWMPLSDAPQFRVAPPASTPAPPIPAIPTPRPVAMTPSPAFVPPPLTAGLNFRDPITFSQPVGLMMGLIAVVLVMLTALMPVVRLMDRFGDGQSLWSFDFLFGKVLIFAVFGGLLTCFTPFRVLLVGFGALVIGLGLIQLYTLFEGTAQGSFFMGVRSSALSGAVSYQTYWPGLAAIVISGLFMVQAACVRVPDEGLILDNRQLSYAGFWARLVAAIIDLLWAILGGTALVFIALTFLTLIRDKLPPLAQGYLVLLLVGLVTLAVLAVGIGAQIGYAGTPGQMSRRIVVVNAETGRPVAAGTILLRAAAALLSALPLFFGFFWSTFDTKKQTWHDKLTGTTVVHLD
jgi:uncharacterized RDD family membrane protein YckC